MIFEADNFFCLNKACLLEKVMLQMACSNSIVKMKIFRYIVESLGLWHERLGHVNFRSIQLMMKNGLIKDCGKDHVAKCITCSKCKITKKPFKSVERISTLLKINPH